MVGVAVGVKVNVAVGVLVFVGVRRRHRREGIRRRPRRTFAWACCVDVDVGGTGVFVGVAVGVFVGPVVFVGVGVAGFGLNAASSMLPVAGCARRSRRRSSYPPLAAMRSAPP